MEYITREEHEEFARRIDEEDKRQNRRIEELENGAREMNRLASATERMATNMENMLKEQERQGERLEKLEGEPAKNWNELKMGVIAAAAAVIGSGLVSAIFGAITK